MEGGRGQRSLEEIKPTFGPGQPDGVGSAGLW